MSSMAILLRHYPMSTFKLSSPKCEGKFQCLEEWKCPPTLYSFDEGRDTRVRNFREMTFFHLDSRENISVACYWKLGLTQLKNMTMNEWPLIDFIFPLKFSRFFSQHSTVLIIQLLMCIEKC